MGEPPYLLREEVDATKGMFRKKREKLQKFEYKLVQSDHTEPVAPKVLPKVPSHACIVELDLQSFKGTVSREFRLVVLYMNLKLFSRAIFARHKMLIKN